VRHRSLIAVAVGFVALAACSDATSGTSTAPSASVTIATASSTTVAASTSSTSTTPPASTSSSSTSSTAATSTSSTSSTSAPTTATPTTALAAPFTPTTAPAVPDITHDVDATWVDPSTQELLSVDDGQYWATVVAPGTDEGGVRFVTLRLVQAFFGDACTARFGSDGCDNDYATLESPTGTMPMFLGAGRISVADPSTQESYEIGGDTLWELLADPTAAVGAPPGYIYAPFAYLVQVQGGQVTSAEQVWTP
jgi:hypothetical protein